MHITPAARFLPSGDTALVVEFSDRIDRRVSALVLTLAEKLDAAAIPGVIEVVPTFRSLMVHYEPLRLPQAELRQRLGPLIEGMAATERDGRHWRLPACYDESLGPDLADVAQRTGLSVHQVVERHSATTFHVYMMGFLPGFPYLGDLPPELELPRRESPRIKVPAGSIAIAMAMTSIYSLESPGGWHLIGRTPVPLWDLRRDPPVLLAAGDKIIFEPISLREFEALTAKLTEGDYRIAPEAAPSSGTRA
ncbi:MAG: 5-oxoprolinase subunit PxpB [Hyphomicrobiaceae bacterium]|nr:MAG: 5-oxoprolinase subunit PxpB [Hyphomicrobiaceae bacterium]